VRAQRGKSGEKTSNLFEVIAGRITMLQQCARGLEKSKTLMTDHNAAEKNETSLERRLESVKYYLWHGNASMALERLGDIDDALVNWGDEEEGEKKNRADSDSAARMLKYVRELDTYITNNASSIVNYGERYRNGERISMGFVESTINQVVSKRMVKKQQIQLIRQRATPQNTLNRG